MKYLLLILLMIKVMMMNGQTHHGHEGNDVIFLEFPHHPEDYKEDVRQIMPAAIQKYGSGEWKLVVMTCELHGHLGIYAIVGAKMGLKAMEYFHSGPDEIQIISKAGSNPPISCLNDGLQVSTGATMGHGLFSVEMNCPVMPSAEFIYDGRHITVSLKEDVRLKIENDVKDCVKKNNGLTENYWIDIRALALQYWLELDRNSIFDISE
jgi:formylmethanofuran dehydrogenase subunit E